jgi:hypothetical protein
MKYDVLQVGEADERWHRAWAPQTPAAKHRRVV